MYHGYETVATYNSLSVILSNHLQFVRYYQNGTEQNRTEQNRTKQNIMILLDKTKLNELGMGLCYNILNTHGYIFTTFTAFMPFSKAS